MDYTFARDTLNQHLVDGESLTESEVDDIVAAGVAPKSDFEERLPLCWWHNSFEPFPEGWTEEDQAAIEEERMEEPFVLFHCPSGLVPQDNVPPRFATVDEAVTFEVEENEYTIEDTAFIVRVGNDGSLRVVYEFGEGDDPNFEEE